MGTSFEEWWNALGQVTKHVAAAVVLISAGITTGVLSPAAIAVYTTGPSSWLQLAYRPLTSALCCGAFSMNWIMLVPTFISFVSRNELGSFVGKPVDFVWMLLFLSYSAGALALALGFFWTNASLLLALCWVYSKRNPGARTSFFGFDFSTAYFPWVLVAFNFIVSQSIIPELVGIFVGHMYVFLQDVYPVTHGKRWLRTPSLLGTLMARLGVTNQGTQFGSVHGQPPYGAARAAAADAAAGRHNWGHGRALGD